MKTFFI